MTCLPEIYVVDDLSVREGHRYRIWIGRRDSEQIVFLALSRFSNPYTIGCLLLQINAEFEPLEAFVDVFRHPEHPNCGVIAEFWSPSTSEYRHFQNIENIPEMYQFVFDEGDFWEYEWKKALGVDTVNLDSFCGPIRNPEEFPDFPKKYPEATATINPPKPITTPAPITAPAKSKEVVSGTIDETIPF